MRNISLTATPEQQAFIKANRDSMSLAEMAEKLGITKNKVNYNRWALKKLEQKNDQIFDWKTFADIDLMFKPREDDRVQPR